MCAGDRRHAGDDDARCDIDRLQSGGGVHSAVDVLQSECVRASTVDVLHSVGPNRSADPRPNIVVAASTDNAVGVADAVTSADASDTDHPIARSVPSGIAGRARRALSVVVSGFSRTSDLQREETCDGGDSARRWIAAVGCPATTRTTGKGRSVLTPFSDLSSDDKNDRGRDHSRGFVRRRPFAASAPARRWWHSSHPRCVRTRVHSEFPD
jgi:hypothetical protein